MVQDDDRRRKGAWTEYEDFQLVFYVHMYGDRRWDFIAKVSGLKRNGKGCRLRWLNYLNPGLKRGKLAPHEERLVLELQSKLGNRWSEIARKLPGRTDNEIKNYWRTRMRRKSQVKKRVMSSLSLSRCSSSSSICTTVVSMPMIETEESSLYDKGGVEKITVREEKNNNDFKSGNVSDMGQEGYNNLMDEIWKDLELLEDDSININPFFDPSSEIAPSLSWTMDGQEEFAENTFIGK